MRAPYPLFVGVSSLIAHACTHARTHLAEACSAPPESVALLPSKRQRCSAPSQADSTAAPPWPPSAWFPAKAQSEIHAAPQQAAAYRAPPLSDLYG